MEKGVAKIEKNGEAGGGGDADEAREGMGRRHGERYTRGRGDVHMS